MFVLQVRSDSMASVYSGAGEGRYGTVAVRGQVEFGLQYNYKAGALEIHVKQVNISKISQLKAPLNLTNCLLKTVSRSSTGRYKTESQRPLC